MEQSKRIFLKFERLPEDVKLEQAFEKDEEKYVYVMGIASTEDENSAGFVVENRALLEAWANCQNNNKHIAVYEKHGLPMGKVVNCEEYNGKILVVMEIPKLGNERQLSVYEQGIYIGLSIGGWSLDGEWIDDIYHVTEFDWYEVSWTDIPSNENALMLEAALASKPKKECEEDGEEPKEEDEEPKDEPKDEEECKDKKKVKQEITEEDVKIVLENIRETIRGNF